MQYYTVKEAANKLKVGEGLIYKAVQRGEIKKSSGVGRLIRISSTELNSLGKTKKERNTFTFHRDLVEVKETHLGKVRKIKKNGYLVGADLVNAIKVKDSYIIRKAVDEKYINILSYEQAKSFGITSNQHGIMTISQEGLIHYSKICNGDRAKIDWDRFLKELYPDECTQTEIQSNTQVKKKLDSREVAEMMEVNHADLLRKINGINKDFTKSKIAFSKYWEESAYKDGSGKSNRNFLITKRGCEFLAHKTTGTKGNLFTDRYMDRFENMKDYIEKGQAPKKFVDNYFSKLSLETRNTIKQELIKKNKQLQEAKAKLEKEIEDNKLAINQL